MNKSIVGYENYEVNEIGEVYSIKNNKILKPLDNGNGYIKVHLYKNGKMKHKYVHRLVAEAFLDNPMNLKYIDHIDRDKTNNKVTNLRWCTAKQNTNNIANRSRYSISRKNFTHHDNSIKLQVAKDYKDGMKVMEIAKKYNIPRQTVSRFKNFRDGH